MSKTYHLTTPLTEEQTRELKAGDIVKANEYADKYIAQGNICMPSEYFQLYKIFKSLERHEEAKKYLNLAMRSDSAYNESGKYFEVDNREE